MRAAAEHNAAELNHQLAAALERVGRPSTAVGSKKHRSHFLTLIDKKKKRICQHLAFEHAYCGMYRVRDFPQSTHFGSQNQGKND